MGLFRCRISGEANCATVGAFAESAGISHAFERFKRVPIVDEKKLMKKINILAC
jgi:hypothetical protein